jgi:hypothetical protein
MRHKKDNNVLHDVRHDDKVDDTDGEDVEHLRGEVEVEMAIFDADIAATTVAAL